MSDELHDEPEIISAHDSAMESDDEYEEISSDEVDEVVDQLEVLIESVQSENIRFHLAEAAAQIYRLVYDDETPAQEEAA